MAVLSESDRAALWAAWQRENVEACGITKADLRAAVNAADSWVDAAASSYNSALPLPARTTLTRDLGRTLLADVVVSQPDVVVLDALEERWPLVVLPSGAVVASHYRAFLILQSRRGCIQSLRAHGGLQSLSS
jgi:hypothetical protein